jgi:zona occludens toxin (predicted ATPase)
MGLEVTFMPSRHDDTDIVMAIENIGNLLEDIAGSLELMVLAFQGVYK